MDRVVLLAPVACLCLLLAVAPVGAQEVDGYTLDLVASWPTDPILPDTGSATIAWTATITCLGVAPSAEPVGNLQLRPRSEHVALVGPLSFEVSLPDCARATESSVDGEIEAYVGMGAPGLEPLPAVIDAELTWVSPLSEPSASARVEGALVAQFIGLVSINTSGTVLDTSKGEARTALFVANLGNARTTVGFDVQHTEGDLIVIPPGDLFLERATPSSRSETETELMARLDGCKQETFRVLVEPVAAGDPEARGMPVTLSFLARGACVGSPGVPFVAVTLALVAAVGIRRVRG